MKDKINQNDPFGFNKAINWDKLNDPKILNELEKLLEDKRLTEMQMRFAEFVLREIFKRNKPQAPRKRHN